ncbi:MAG TPA: DUF4214 domain-containing protein [Burkholderiaceae bacterium]
MAEGTSYSTAVQELYVAYFGRPADYGGWFNFQAALSNADAPTDLAGLATAYNSNAAVKTLVDAFSTSEESQALYGTVTGNATAFVNAIFENMFGRAAGPAGLQFWSNAITSGVLTASDAALSIAAGAVANTSAQGVLDAATLSNKTAAAQVFTNLLADNVYDSASYRGPFAAEIGRALVSAVGTANLNAGIADAPWAVRAIDPAIVDTYTLTPTIDNVATGRGVSVINATLDNAAGLAAGGPAATLTADDSIVGDTQLFSFATLNIFDSGLGANFAIPQPGIISGITTLTVTSLEAVSAPSAANGSIQLSGWAGLTDVNILASTGIDSLAVPAATNVLVRDSAGDVTVYGGARIVVTTDAASTTTIVGGTASSSIYATGGASGRGNTITDAHFGSGLSNTIKTVVLTDAGHTAIDSDALTSLSLSGAANDVAVHAAAGTRTLALALSGDDGGAVADDTATNIAVAANGYDTGAFTLQAHGASTIGFVDTANLHLAGVTAPVATTVTIGGIGAFTADLSQLNTTADIDATGENPACAVSLVMGNGATGTITFGMHTAADQITVSPVGTAGAAPNFAKLLTVSGLNNVGQDSIVFADGEGVGTASFQQVGIDQVTKAGASATSLDGWIAAATGMGGVVQQSAHGVLEFQFGGNTYLIETAAASDAGSFGAHDAIIELTGTGYTFAHASSVTEGVLHLAG